MWMVFVLVLVLVFCLCIDPRARIPPGNVSTGAVCEEDGQLTFVRRSFGEGWVCCVGFLGLLNCRLMFISVLISFCIVTARFCMFVVHCSLYVSV